MTAREANRFPTWMGPLIAFALRSELARSAWQNGKRRQAAEIMGWAPKGGVRGGGFDAAAAARRFVFEDSPEEPVLEPSVAAIETLARESCDQGKKINAESVLRKLQSFRARLRAQLDREDRGEQPAEERLWIDRLDDDRILCALDALPEVLDLTR